MKKLIFTVSILLVLSAQAFSSNSTGMYKLTNPISEMNKLIIIGDGSDEGDLAIFLVATIQSEETVKNCEFKVFSLFYIYSLQYLTAESIDLSNTIVFDKAEDDDMWNMTMAMPNFTFAIDIDTQVSIKITKKTMTGSSVLAQEKLTIEEFNDLFDVLNFY